MGSFSSISAESNISSLSPHPFSPRVALPEDWSTPLNINDDKEFNAARIKLQNEIEQSIHTESDFKQPMFESIAKRSPEGEAIWQRFDGRAELFNNILVSEYPQPITDETDTDGTDKYLRYELIIYLDFIQQFVRTAMITTQDTIQRMIPKIIANHRRLSNNQCYFSKTGLQCFQFIVEDACNEAQRTKKCANLEKQLHKYEKYRNQYNNPKYYTFEQCQRNVDGFKQMITAIQPLHTELSAQHKYLKAPKLSGHTYESYLNVIQHFFTSPSLLTQKWFYDFFTIIDATDNTKVKFDFPPILAEYLRFVGSVKLRTMDSIVQRMSTAYRLSFDRMSDIDISQLAASPPLILKSSQDLGTKDWNFHTLIVAERPSNERNNATTQWSLKLIGRHMLVTIQWQNDDKRHNFTPHILRIETLENNLINRQIFWHWWDGQSTRHSLLNINDDISPNYMTTHWSLVSLLHQQTTAEQISLFIEKYAIQWPEYDTLTNSCQDFVTTIIAAFDVDTAKELMRHATMSAANQAATPVLFEECKEMDFAGIYVSFNEAWSKHLQSSPAQIRRPSRLDIHDDYAIEVQAYEQNLAEDEMKIDMLEKSPDIGYTTFGSKQRLSQFQSPTDMNETDYPSFDRVSQDSFDSKLKENK